MVSFPDTNTMDISAFERALRSIENVQPRNTYAHTRGTSFWRKEEPILEPGTTHVRVGGMWPHQRELNELRNRIKVLVGGLGSGKTLHGGKRIISLALQNSPCAVMAVSPTFPIARKTTIPAISGLLEGKRRLYGPSTLVWRFNKSLLEFHIRYKGRDALIYIGSAEDPDSLRGSNLAGAWMDEPFIMEYQAFIMTLSRIRHPDAVHEELLLTGTPEQLNWGYELCVGEMEEKHDVGVVFASTRANKALSATYVPSLEASMDERMAQAYIDGRFVSFSKGQVYYAFNQQENVVRMERPQGAILGAGMDFNVNPMAACVFWQLGDHVHFFQEWELPNSDTEYMCQHLLDNHPGLVNVYPDASGASRHTNAPGGKTDYYFIRQAGLEINAKHDNPKQKDRYNATNSRLKPRTEQVKLTIDPRCKRLIRYLNTYTHENKTKTEGKAMSHLLDAFSYPIAYLFPVNRSALTIKVVGH